MLNKLFLDKSAGEKLLSLWWFFALGVIGGGIVTGVVIYYSADTNTNYIESDILISRLSECMISNNYLNENVLNDNFDIFSSCNLDPKMFQTGSFIYFNVSIYNDSGLIRNFSAGNFAFENDCRVGMKITSTYFPKCSRTTYFTKRGNENIQVSILGGLNQIGSKVPLS